MEDHATKFIDEKRRYLERRLSASQRDPFLIKEAKEDRLEKKELREMLKSSTLTSALKNMSETMLNMSNAIAKTMENLSHPISAPAPNLMSIPPFGSYNFLQRHQQILSPQLHCSNQYSTDENLTSTPNVKSTPGFYQRMLSERFFKAVA